MFNVRFERIVAGQPASGGIVFELTLDNCYQRKAAILSYDFELWLLRNENPSETAFLTRLSPDLHYSVDFTGEFGPHDQKPFRLLWHYTSRQLQQVEDMRKGESPLLEIRGHISVMSVWPGEGGTDQLPQFQFGRFWHSKGTQGASYPMRIAVPQSEWITLLNQLGFQHITLYEFPSRAFPPAFSRSETLLREAWEHHGAGRRDEALLACRKAFEGLGYNLFGEDKIARRELLERLMPAAEARKKDAVVQFWESLQDLFSNIGVHERGGPIELTHSDTQMALICATALLGYLAESEPNPKP